MILSSILNTGVTLTTNSSDEKKIRLLNAITLVWLSSSLMYCVMEILFNPTPQTNIITHLMCIPFLTGIFILQKKQYYNIARSMYIIGMFFIIYYFAFVLEPGKLLEYFFLLVAPVTLLFFDNLKIPVVVLILSILSFFIPNIYLKNTQMTDVPVTKLVIFVGVFVNLGYLKKLNIKNEQLLKKQKKELEEIHEFQNRFFINIAHEIKTPLTIINGQVNAIQKLTEQPVEALSILKNQTKKIHRIVDDIIDLTRLNKHVLNLRLHPTDIISLVEKIHHSFQSNFANKHIEYTYSTTIKNEVFALIDHVYLERALNNILLNALKYTPEYGKVVVLLKKVNNNIVVAIRDSGIGIPKSEHKKVFDLFYQTNHTINQTGGSGIGLAFCKEVIEKHHGELSLVTNDSTGVTFSISLPIINEIELDSKPASVSSSIAINKKETRILLLEDNVDMQKYLLHVLKDYQLTLCSNGIEGLKMIESNEFNMIITDYMMPHLDGFGFIKQIREKGIETPLIVLTARTDQQAKLNILRLGIDDYITKPFDEEELIIRIHNNLRNFEEKEQFRITESEDTELTYSNFMTELTDFIETHCVNNNFGIADICEEFALSTSSLYRKVKQESGMSPKEFVTEVRLQKVRQLYDSQKFIDLKDLSYQVGFVNYSHLNKLYEKRFGKSLKNNF